MTTAAPPAGGESAAPAGGLTAREAALRLRAAGPNEPAPRRARSLATELLVLFLNPLVAALLLASVAATLLGQHVDATIIIVVVLLGVGLNFVQTYRSRRAAQRLRERVAATATAMRDGRWVEVPRRELVPGDVIRLTAGDLVPADAGLLTARDLHVQQAALTGESLPVEKEVPARGAPAERAGARAPPAAAADRVFLGTSVVSGTATAMVEVTGAATAYGGIAAQLAARAPETEFERGLRQFGLLIMQAVMFLVLVVLGASIALHHDPLESLLFAVALAVGLTPEFLPMITSVTLARGAVRMARRRVIVKQLAAIQNLGSIDVLCSDKTGTITTGTVTLEQVEDAAGSPARRPLELANAGAALATGIHSPLDAAVLARAARDGLTAPAPESKCDEIPFDFERRLASIVVHDAGGCRLIAKGAPESVLARCAAVEHHDGPQPLDAALRAALDRRCAAWGSDGYRVLAVATRHMAEQPAYGATDERDLVLAGFLVFADPPRPDAAAVIDALRGDGVRVLILTGDTEQVTRHVSARVGLDAGTLVTGAELDRASDAALGHVVEGASVYARLTPAQKNRVIRALRARGHVVGYLGDGINDAPSLHEADVGISVSGAVDVAREAADVILVEPGLDVLHEGIVEGRRAFGNVMKYLLMGTSSNFGNMVSMAGASLFLPFLPMLPTQILLNNFLYDLAQVTIPGDRVDASYTRRPHRWDIGIIRRFMLVIGPVSSLFDALTFGVLLVVFHAGRSFFHTGWFVESLATQTLVLFVIRTMGNPFRSRPSLPLAATTVAVVLAGILLPFSPLAGALGFVPLPATYFAFLGVAVPAYLALVELVKRRLMARLMLGTR